MIEIIIKILFILVAVFVVDFIWALYIKYISDLEENKSATTGTIIYLLGGIVIIAYTTQYFYLIPAAIGAFFGTKYSVRFKKYLIKNHYDEISYMKYLFRKIKRLFKIKND